MEDPKPYTKLDHVVFGLADSTPNNVDEATERRISMWYTIIRGFGTISEVKQLVKILTIAMIGLTIAQITLTGILIYSLL